MLTRVHDDETKLMPCWATSETKRPLAPNTEPRRSHRKFDAIHRALSCSTTNRVVCASQNGIVFIVSTHHMLHCLPCMRKDVNNTEHRPTNRSAWAAVISSCIVSNDDTDTKYDESTLWIVVHQISNAVFKLAPHAKRGRTTRPVHISSSHTTHKLPPGGIGMCVLPAGALVLYSYDGRTELF